MESILDKALEGRELSAEDGEALFAAEGDSLHRLLSAADELAAPQGRRQRRLRHQPERQFHERLREAMRILRVQPRPSRGARLFPANRGDSSAGSRSSGSRRDRSLHSGGAAAAHGRIVLHRSLRGYQERTSPRFTCTRFRRRRFCTARRCLTGASKIICRLSKTWGSGRLPGTSAEILDDRVREIISPGRISTRDWITVIRTAHKLGIPTTSTIMYGHVETALDRARHLELLRGIQKETGGITEFVPLSFIASRGAHGEKIAGARRPYGRHSRGCIAHVRRRPPHAGSVDSRIFRLHG